MANSLLHITANESLLEVKDYVDELIRVERSHRATMARCDLTTEQAPPEYFAWRQGLIEQHERRIAGSIAQIRETTTSFFRSRVPGPVRQEYLRGVERELERLQRERNKSFGQACLLAGVT